MSDNGTTGYSDGELLLHLARLWADHEPLIADCPLCAAIIEKVEHTQLGGRHDDR